MASSINASTSGAGGVITTADNTGILNLQSGGANVATINAFGIGLGTGVPSSGIGITFPATQSASSDANTLDDYEEGTWTPNVGGTATYTTQVGSYVKIGKLVFIKGNLKINTIGTGATNNIKGLPFAAGQIGSSGDEYTIPVDKSDSLSASIVWMALRTSGADLYATYRTAASASSTVNGNFLQNSTEMQFAGCYIAQA